MIYTMDFEWKNYNVNLSKVLEEIKELDSNCIGVSGNSKMQAHFSEEPSEETKTAILAYWDGLTDQSAEATSYKSAEDVIEQIASLKADAATKSYDNLSAVQKKLLFGLPTTTEELFV